MALTIRKPSENRFIKVCVFAPAGAGKTVLAGSAQLDERTSPMFLLDFEGGSESLAGLDIDVAEIKSWPDYNEAFEHLVENLEKYEPGHPERYKSCGIDSISETHKFALLSIIDKEKDNRNNPDLLEQRDYGTATIQMRRLLRHFRDLPLHVFFIAHAKEIEIPREGRVRIPDLAGQMAEEVSGLVSVQGYLAQFEENKETHRTLLLHSWPKFRIKARTPWGVTAPEEIIDPTITDLLDALGYGVDSVVPENGKSSRGKHIDDNVPLKDENALPGTPIEGESEGKTKEDKQEEPPEGERTDEETEPTGPQDDDKEPEPPAPSAEIDVSKANVVELRNFGKENGVDMRGANTKKKAHDKLKEAGLVP